MLVLPIPGSPLTTTSPTRDRSVVRRYDPMSCSWSSRPRSVMWCPSNSGGTRSSAQSTVGACPIDAIATARIGPGRASSSVCKTPLARSPARAASFGRPAATRTSMRPTQADSRSGCSMTNASSGPTMVAGLPRRIAHTAPSSVARQTNSESRATSGPANSSTANSSKGRPRTRRRAASSWVMASSKCPAAIDRSDCSTCCSSSVESRETWSRSNT